MSKTLDPGGTWKVNRMSKEDFMRDVLGKPSQSRVDMLGKKSTEDRVDERLDEREELLNDLRPKRLDPKAKKKESKPFDNFIEKKLPKGVVPEKKRAIAKDHTCNSFVEERKRSKKDVSNLIDQARRK